MNIAILCHSEIGGSSRIACELAGWLIQEKQNVHLISIGEPPRLLPEETKKHIQLHTLNVKEHEALPYSLNSESLAIFLCQIIEAHHIDIVHAHYAMPYAFSIWASKQWCTQPFRSVLTFHGTDASQMPQDPTIQSLLPKLMDACDAITVVSEYLRSILDQQFSHKNKVLVIPNFIRCQHWSPSPHHSEENSSYPSLIHLSNFRSIKHIERALEIFSYVRQKHQARLVLAGDGPRRPYIEALANQHPQQKDIIFLGSTLDSADLLCRSDIFLSTSEEESFGLATLEAMACGLPVVIPNIPGFRAWISDNEEGLFYQSGDTLNASEKVLCLLRDTLLRKSISAKAREKSRDAFAIENIAPQYLNLYQRLISKSPQ